MEMLTMTVEANGHQSDQQDSTDIENMPFAVNAHCDNGVFCVEIQGRMDTITAPKLLEDLK